MIKKKNPRSRLIPYLIYILVIILLLIATGILQRGQQPEVISSAALRDMLVNQDLRRVEILNEEVAHIYIKSNRLNLDKYQDAASGTEGHYRLTIGSIEVFEQAIKEIQEDAGISREEMISPMYVTKVNWLPALLSWVLPIIFLIVIGAGIIVLLSAIRNRGKKESLGHIQHGGGQMLKKYRLTTEQYLQMGEAGIIPEDQRVELIKGEIIEKGPISSAHGGAVKLLNTLLHELLSDQHIISVQNPVQLGRYTEPEPDLAVLKHKADFYAKSHPTPSDVLMLIEVADSSLQKDREVKLPLYAETGIPEVWIINLPEKQVEVYRHADGAVYKSKQVYKKEETIQGGMISTLKANDIFL